VNVTVPDSVTRIGEYAFHYCSSLKAVTFGENSQLSEIGVSAFFNCSSLTSITIPDGVTGIGDEAFSVCSSLASITIPDNVTGIGSCAFSSCESLKKIYYRGTEEQWNAISKGYEWNYNTGSGSYTVIYNYDGE